MVVNMNLWLLAAVYTVWAATSDSLPFSLTMPNPFALDAFAEKCCLKRVKQFSGYQLAKTK